MKRLTLWWLLTVALSACLFADAAPAQGPAAPTPLPKEVVDAWRKAGATVQQPRAANDVPEFSFRAWRDGILADLPVPQQAFGLTTPSSINVTDDGLKGLGRFTTLQALNLYGTNVTDVGLKELAGLKN